MARTGDPDLDRRLHAAFRGVTADFSVNMQDGMYRSRRRIATAVRAIGWTDFADEIDRDAERLIAGEDTK